MFTCCCLQLSYAANVSEGAAVGDAVARVAAKDRDSGHLGAVRYAIVAERNAEGAVPFAIGEESGVIVLREKLDYERRKEYTFKVYGSYSNPVVYGNSCR